MRLLEFCAHLAVDWCVVSVIAVGAYAFAMRNRRKPRPPWTNWDHNQPPVPETDAAWLSVWPDAVDDDALCDAEFVSLIATTWVWPDTEDAA